MKVETLFKQELEPKTPSSVQYQTHLMMSDVWCSDSVKRFNEFFESSERKLVTDINAIVHTQKIPTDGDFTHNILEWTHVSEIDTLIQFLRSVTEDFNLASVRACLNYSTPTKRFKELSDNNMFAGRILLKSSRPVYTRFYDPFSDASVSYDTKAGQCMIWPDWMKTEVFGRDVDKARFIEFDIINREQKGYTILQKKVANN